MDNIDRIRQRWLDGEITEEEAEDRMGEFADRERDNEIDRDNE